MQIYFAISKNFRRAQVKKLIRKIIDFRKSRKAKRGEAKSDASSHIRIYMYISLSLSFKRVQAEKPRYSTVRLKIIITKVLTRRNMKHRRLNICNLEDGLKERVVSIF